MTKFFYQQNILPFFFTEREFDTSEPSDTSRYWLFTAIGLNFTFSLSKVIIDIDFTFETQINTFKKIK